MYNLHIGLNLNNGMQGKQRTLKEAWPMEKLGTCLKPIARREKMRAQTRMKEDVEHELEGGGNEEEWERNKVGVGKKTPSVENTSYLLGVWFLGGLGPKLTNSLEVSKMVERSGNKGSQEDWVSLDLFVFLLNRRSLFWNPGRMDGCAVSCFELRRRAPVKAFISGVSEEVGIKVLKSVHGAVDARRMNF